VQHGLERHGDALGRHAGKPVKVGEDFIEVLLCVEGE